MATEDEKKASSEAQEVPSDENAAAAGAAEPAAEAAAAAAEPAAAAGAEGAEEAVEAEAEAVLDAAERLIEAEATAAAMRDKYLRLQAEWDNYRKRTAEEAADMRVRAAEKLLNDLLPVIDDIDRAIAHAEQNGEAGMLDGVKAIGTKLSDVLGKHGLEAIDPAGEAFNALEHQAVAQVPDESVPDETVEQVYQKGYRLGKRVLRPAMVTISSGGPKREPDAAATDDK